MHTHAPLDKPRFVVAFKPTLLVALTLFVGIVAAPRSAHALQLEAAARLGYSLPGGKFIDADNAALSDAISAQIPLQLDLGMRFFDLLSLTLYGQVAPGLIAGPLDDECSALNVSCGAAAFRFGFQAHVHFRGKETVDPWAGVGLGFESLVLSAKQGDNRTTTAYGGYEVPVQAGVDFKLIDMLRLGPMVGYSFGTFGGDVTETCEGGNCDTAEDVTKIDSTASHHFWTFGAKVTFLIL